MPKKKKIEKTAAPAKKPEKAAAKEKTAKGEKSKAKTAKARKLARSNQSAEVEVAELISSEVVYQGSLFRVLHDKLLEPGGKPSERDVIRHNGSVVILAIDSSKSKNNPGSSSSASIATPPTNSSGNCPPASSKPAKIPSPAPGASWPRKPATAPKSGSRWSSTTPAPVFSANP
jgi:hypothetical protein